MDADRFDSLSRNLAAVGTRRQALRFLATLPLASALIAALSDWSGALAVDDDHGSSHRRQRRRSRHKHRPGKGKNRRKEKARRDDPGQDPVPDPGPDTVQPVCIRRTCTPGRCGAEPDGCGGTLQCGCDSTRWCAGETCVPCDVCQTAGACAYDSVTTAVQDGAGPSIIRVCPGTYSGNSFISRDVEVIGAGDGPAEMSNTILTSTASSSSIIRVAGAVTVNLQGLRVTGARMSGEVGAGVSVLDATVTIENCTIIDNHTDIVGGGLSNNSGHVTLINTTIANNRAESTTPGFGQGGGIYTYNADSVLTLDATSRVTGNVASVSGGGIYNFFDHTDVTLTSTDTVTGNTPDNCFGARNGPADACAPPSSP